MRCHALDAVFLVVVMLHTLYVDTYCTTMLGTRVCR